jgi:hypothetical protein
MRLDHPAKLHPVGLGSAHMHVTENLLASGLGQLLRLGVNALALAARRYLAYPYFMASLCTYILHKKGA